MPDVSDLLRLGAGPDHPDVDVAAVAARARVLQRQRALGRSGALGAAVALLLLGGLQLSPGGGSERLRPVPLGPAGTPVVPAASAVPTAAGALAAPAPRAAAPRPAASGARPAREQRPQPAAPAATPVPPRPGPVVVSPSPQPGREEHPRARGCTVTTEGALPGEKRSCRFTAVADGGYEARLRGGAGVDLPEYEVLVVRAGRSMSYTRGTCANAVVRPGDRVTVSVTKSSRGLELFDVSAGADAGC